MRAFAKLRLRLRLLFLRSRTERELDDELQFHLEAQIAENVAHGMTPSAARAAALRSFGGVPQIEEACRETRGLGAWEGFLRDLRQGFRLMRKSPAYASSSISVLALGIAAATAIFSAAHAILLRPLPFPEPEQLVRVWDNYGSPGNLGPVSYPNYSDWRAWSHSFSELAAYTHNSYVLTGWGEPTPLETIAGSANFLDVFGVKPALGRTFRAEEDQPGANDGADSVVLSDRLWRTRFGGNPEIVGRRIMLARLPFVVIGVMPRGFTTYTGSGETDVWTTLANSVRLRPGAVRPLTAVRSISFLNVVGRLKRGVQVESAQRDLDHVATLLVRNYPADDPKDGMTIQSLQKSATDHLRPLLVILLWAAAAVLLIACADIGGLALARVTRRQREISVRAAMGAGKWRLIRQLLAESLILAGSGAVLGVLLAGFLVRFLVVFLQLPPGGITVEWPALVFAAGAATLSAVVFSLAPVIHVMQFDVLHGLKESAASVTASARQRRLRGILAAGQIALAMVLLSACGLLGLNLIHLRSAALGFDAQNTLTFLVGVPSVRYPQADRARFLDELTAKLRSIPGVRSASAGTQMPFRGNTPRTVLDNVDGRAIPLRGRTGIVYSPITPEYFQTLGVPILRGRPFTESDTAAGAPVVILNQAAAERYFGAVDPLGRQVTPEMWDGSGSSTQPRTVVGIAGNVTLEQAGEKPYETVYWPVAQIPSESSYWIAVRTVGDPLMSATAVREQLRKMDRDIPFYKASPLAAAVESTLLQPRYNTTLVAFFAVVALILTAVGLYGSIAYSVSQRTQEIGIRIALGAHRDQVLRQFVRGGLATSVAGVVVGLAFAKGATHIMKTLVFGASVDEPVTFALSAVVLIAVALAASYIPARRAARIDPMRALRND